MVRRLHRNIAGGFAVLAAGSVIALPSSLRLPVREASSVVAEADAINLKATDLSASMHWLSAPPGKSSKASTALADQAVACLQKVGPVSPDPFGTRTLIGGVVLADVSSPTYYEKGSSIELPSASSEVVFLTTTSAAAADLSTFGRGSALACLTAQLIGNSTLGGAGKVKGSASYLAAPHYGGRSGGLHIRFIETAGNLGKSKLYDDEYCYVQGPAEISLSFIGLGAPFNATWATSAISKVMARAQSEIGKS
ncbi:MAG: hypothetical protein ABR972_11075 [Acidimicrobiales bacterium]